MSPHPLVSLIVRTQGRRRALLEEALASIAAQTYPCIEAIVVEDGSDAAAESVAQVNAVRPGAFRRLTLQLVGRSAAGNAGLNAAQGAILGFLDDDDRLLADHVERLVSAMTAANAEFAYAQAQPVALDGRTPAGAPLGDVPFSRALLWVRNAIPIQAALFRREAFERHGGLDTDLDALEDWDLWLRYTAASDPVAVKAVTSVFRMPTDKAALEERASAHAPAAERLAQKHAALSGACRFGDVHRLPAQTRAATPFRVALRLAVEALHAKLSGLAGHDGVLR
jgi:glycosyltransferase involved in cell wall biosynthesis